MRIFLKTSDLLSKAGLGLAAAMLIGMVCLILAEIVLRSVFDTSTFIMDDFVAHGVAGTTFFSLSYTLSNGGILRMSLLLEQLGPKSARFLDFITILTGLAIIGFLIHFSFLRVERAVERGSTSSSIVPVPVWIPEGIICFGLAMVFIQMLALLVKNLMGQPLPGSTETFVMEE